MRRVIVHIDRVSLHGLDASAARIVTAALQQELSSRFADPGLSLSALQVAMLPPLHLGATPGAAALGRAARSAVAAALGAQPARRPA